MAISLSSSEIKKLVNLLDKIKFPNKALPQEVFDALVRIMPVIACEIVLINSKKEFFLTWREDQYWRGWHFPGGLLRFRESFEERLQRTAKKELGIILQTHKFLFPINYLESPRGHDVSLVFLCTTKTIPKYGKFFKRMPQDIIPEHIKLWKKIKKYLKK